MMLEISRPAVDLSLDRYPDNGCAVVGAILDRAKCKSLRDWLSRARPLTAEMFYQSEADFEKHGRWHRYAPGPGHNVLEGLGATDLDFVE